LDCEGRVTIGEGSTRLKQKIGNLISTKQNKILLNFERVSYIDSSGTSELTSSFIALQKTNGTLKFLNVSPKIRSFIGLTKMLEIFEMFDNEEEALQSFA
jgi:anti-sigma B factor antagonist